MSRRLALALFLLSSVAGAQVTEKIDVTVTNLDLIVTDGAGRPIRGLSKDDFVILENGKPRNISNFSEVSVGTVAMGTISQPPPRSIILMFDNSSLTLGARRVASEAAIQWIDQYVRPVDRVSVMATIPTLQIKQQWTRDKATINNAIDLTLSQSVSTSEQERRAAEKRIEDVINRARSASPRETVRFDEAVDTARVYAAAEMRDHQAVLSSLAKSLTYFSRPAEKRVIVIVGEGVSTNPGAEMYNRLNYWKMAIESGGGPARLLGGARSSSPLTEATQFDLKKEIEAVARIARGTGVVMYALNPGHNERTGGMVQETRPTDVSTEFANSTVNMSGYDLLVRATGGMAFYGTPPKQAFERIGREIGSYYSIGFHPDPDLKGEPKISVRTRQGSPVRISRATPVRSSDEMMRLAVQAHHVAPPETNDLRISVAVGDPSPEGDLRRVPLKILIPVALLRLEPEGNEVTGGFVVYVSTGTEAGSISRINRQTHDIRWPAAALDQARTRNMVFSVDVMIGPGSRQISVGVIDQKSEQTGFDLVSLSASDRVAR